MSIAWATILIVLLLLPGIAFLGGLSLRMRQSRDIVRSNVIGDIGLAVGLSVAFHLLAVAFLVLVGVFIWLAAGIDMSRPLRALAYYAIIPQGQLLERAFAWLLAYLIYTLAVCLFAGAVGMRVGRERCVATHQWAYDLDVHRRESQNVIAYIVTNIKEGSRVLMYKGVLLDFYQEQNGTFAYVILGTCSRYFLDMNEPRATTPPVALFSSFRPRTIDYFFVDGKNIANILFDTVDLDLGNIEQIIADQTNRPPPRPRTRPAKAKSPSRK